MSKKFRLLVVAAVMIAALVLPTAAFAQSATNTAWTSSITYYTPSSTPGTLVVSFYAENSGTNIDLPAITLAAHKAGTIVVGGVSGLADGFKGSAVLSSDVYVVATAVQYAAGTEANNYGRMLYSGFSAADAAPTVYIATVLRASAGSTSTVAVQNTESFAANVNVKLYAVGNPIPVNTFDVTVPAGSDAILGGGTNAHGLFVGSGAFSGSLVLTGSQSGAPGTPAKLVASAQETKDADRAAYAFEGVAGGAADIYMASAMCNATPTVQTSYFAIQNTSLTTSTDVTIHYFDSTGADLGTTVAQPIAAGGKLSTNPCAFAAMNGKLGSAVIHSSATNIIAIGKVLANNGMLTAFVGASAGSTKVAAPYVRWAADPTKEWRSYIAVMNVGGAAANNISVTFYNNTGTAVKTVNLAAAGAVQPFTKRSTDPQSAGALAADQSFGVGGGSIEVTSDQPVVVVVRATKNVSLGTTTMFAEDYNGVSIP